MDTREQTYRIAKTWDNDPLPSSEIVTVKLSSIIDPSNCEEQLVISAEAPFYDDPHIPDDTPAPKGTKCGLWEYEVVEVFLLGSNDHYLEIEISPKGQHLLLELKGFRNVVQDKLPLLEGNYVASIDTSAKRWTGRVIIPTSYLPENITKFNMYAIHGSDSKRVYKSLFPTNKDEFRVPDFHRLSHFGPIDFESILPRKGKH